LKAERWVEDERERKNGKKKETKKERDERAGEGVA